MKKNLLTLVLIISSMVLLVVLQFFWIRSAYSEAFDNFRKETDNTFRTTVYALRDTLMQRTFEQISPDSAFRLMIRRRSMMDSMHDDGPEDKRAIMFRKEDAMPLTIVGHARGGKGRVAVAQKGQESKMIFRKDVDHPIDTVHLRNVTVGRDFHDRRDFVFRFSPDSIRIDSISAHLKEAFNASGITLPFKVVYSRRGENRHLGANSFISEPVRISPFSRYALIMMDVRYQMLRAILPQALFSVFLTLLTLISFYILYRSIRSQQRLVQLKNDFISNITHELKTPITTVSVAIEALRNFKGLNNPALTEEYLGIAQNELGRLSILTDKVLKTAIYEDKGISFRLERIDIEKLVTQVLSSLRLILEKNGATVTFEKSGKDFSISGDRDHMINVIYNLLDNAIKYSPTPAVLSINLKEQGSNVILSVGDNGPGIAPEYRKKVFEKFFRVPTGDVHNIKGYGLGLSYVQTVVKSHLGTIEVVANGAKGSCFVVTLPKG